MRLIGCGWLWYFLGMKIGICPQQPQAAPTGIVQTSSFRPIANETQGSSPLLDQILDQFVDQVDVGPTCLSAPGNRNAASLLAAQEADPFEQAEKRQKLWGFNFVFGHVAGCVSTAIDLIGAIKSKFGSHPKSNLQVPSPQSSLENPLAALSSAHLRRPFVFVPGFNTPERQLRPLIDKLCEGGQAGEPVFVQDGRFFQDFDCRKPCDLTAGPESRVFVARFQRMDQPPDQTAPQLAADLQAITQLTGSTKVDVAGFSMGGLSTRVYLDNLAASGAKTSPIENFVMLGTPNHGSALAKLSSWLLEIQQEGYGVESILQWKHVKNSDAAATHWLRPVDGHRPNLHLQDLNSRWPTQRNLVGRAVAMGSDSKKKTYSTYIWPQRGDGVVTIKSVKMPNIPCQVFRSEQFGHHNNLPSSPQTYLALGEVFSWFDRR